VALDEGWHRAWATLIYLPDTRRTVTRRLSALLHIALPGGTSLLKCQRVIKGASHAVGRWLHQQVNRWPGRKRVSKAVVMYMSRSLRLSGSLPLLRGDEYNEQASIKIELGRRAIRRRLKHSVGSMGTVRRGTRCQHDESRRACHPAQSSCASCWTAMYSQLDFV
jgi:hypothetical protein